MSAMTTSAAVLDPAFPLAHRTDLPAHERAVSAETLRLLHEAVASAAVDPGHAIDPRRLHFDDNDD